MNPVPHPLREVVSWGRAVLLGFDGPMCDLFAGHSAATVADELHALIRDRLGGTLPPNVAAAAGDPIEILERHPAAISIPELLAMYLKESTEPERLREVIAIPALSDSWRTDLQKLFDFNKRFDANP